MLEITPIYLSKFIGNCYLIKTEQGFVLIDTGRGARKKLDHALHQAGCHPGNLKLVIITHGDFDHTGNCVYVRDQYRAPIAMHTADAVMVETGNMFAGSRKANPIVAWLVNHLFSIQKFTPDLMIDDHFDLAPYGLDARIIAIPGHSLGSIGILTNEEDLFCGDLLTNWKNPELSSIMDDLPTARQSLAKLQKMDIKNVYPGHGQPFPFSELNR
ncbi:MAG TPA: MBL fold metallo-hydrolase [bacterium]|nr:MBL fold metallo-hydrolase [bacterium]